MQTERPLAPAVPSFGKWAIAFSVALGALLEIVDTSIVNVALTDMAASLDATISQTSWIVSAYAVANVIILPLAAGLSLRFGQKRYFLFSLVGFTIASVVCGLATSLPMLIVARVVQGLAGGGLLAKAQSILFQVFPRKEQAMAQAFFGIVIISGPAIGPTLGGYLVTNVGWRWIFFVNVPIGILATTMVWLTLPPDGPLRRFAERIDLPGILFLAIGLGCLETFLEEGNADGWFESNTITAFAVASVLGLVAFVWRELTTPNPAVDLRVLRHRSLWVGSIISVVLGVALYGALFVIPIFSEQVMHMTSQQVGMMLLPSALAAAVMMPVVGVMLSKKLDPRVALTIGCVVLGATLHALVPLSPATGEDDFFWPLLVRGAGMVFMFLPLTLATLGSIPKHEVASATGFFNLTRQVGGSIGVALLSTMLTDRAVFHKAIISEHLVSTDPDVLGRLSALTTAFHGHGMAHNDASQAALRVLNGTVAQQASVMSFGDIFWVVSIAVFCMIPLAWMLARPTAGGEAPAGGH